MVETFYVHLEFINKKGIWSINLPFLCTKCGVCCTLNDFLFAGEIKTTPEENPDIYSKLRLIYDELAKLMDKGENVYDEYTLTTPCPFLNDNICSIYPIRPQGCRQFPNTAFGMTSQDCRALMSFKKQCVALKWGRKVRITPHFTISDPVSIVNSNSIIPSVFTNEQYQKCVDKLIKTGITSEELAFFNLLNGKNQFNIS